MCTRLIYALPVYGPIAGPVFNDGKDVTVGALVLNFDCPTVLESFLRADTGAHPLDECVYVVIAYAVKNDTERQTYRSMRENFSRYRFIDVSDENVTAIVHKSMRDMSTDYVLVTDAAAPVPVTVTVAMTHHPSIRECAKVMRATGAYTFSLADGLDVRGPVELLESDTYIRKFACAQAGSVSPHNMFTSLYCVQDVVAATEKMPATSLETFSLEWSKTAVDGHKVGLFCSKK